MLLIHIWMAILATGWLWDVRHYLHPSWYNPGWAAASCSISRGGRATESFCQLLMQGDCNVIGGNVNCISNTQNN